MDCEFCGGTNLEANTECKSCKDFYALTQLSQQWINFKCTAYGASEVHACKRECDDCRYNALRYQRPSVVNTSIGMITEIKFTYFGAEGIDLCSSTLSPYEHYYIKEIASIYNNTLLLVHKQPPRFDRRSIQSAFKKPAYEALIFFRSLIEFNTLEKAEQVELFKQSAVGTMIFSFHYRLDFKEDERKVFKVLKGIWGEFAYNKTMEYLESLAKHRIDKITTCLCFLFHLFNPEYKSRLVNSTRVRRTHATIEHLLSKHLKNNKNDVSGELNSWLNSKLRELPLLEHSHVFVPISDAEIECVLTEQNKNKA